jgi:hypothetical protein
MEYDMRWGEEGDIPRSMGGIWVIFRLYRGYF